MEAIVRLKIVSHTLSPEEISSRLGQEPDRAWRKGTDDRKVSRNMSKCHGWIMNSGTGRDVSIEDQIERLLAKLKPLSNEIRQMSATETVDFSCVVYAQTEPPLYFENKTLSVIAALGANLDVDLYLQTGPMEPEKL
jgi:Domain of unknown function (DUF4279)